MIYSHLPQRGGRSIKANTNTPPQDPPPPKDKTPTLPDTPIVNTPQIPDVISEPVIPDILIEDSTPPVMDMEPTHTKDIPPNAEIIKAALHKPQEIPTKKISVTLEPTPTPTILQRIVKLLKFWRR